MRRNRARGGVGWVRPVTVRPQVRIGRFEAIQPHVIILPGQPQVIQDHRRSRVVERRRVDPVAEALRG